MTDKDLKYYREDDPQYPIILRDYERMPKGLYVKGSLPDESLPSVAIVGARSCSEYGRDCAERFAFELAKNGVQIISGMALGIDCAAHEGALKAKGRTFAVLGCGADVCYPVSKINLYDRIVNNGGIISEYEPGTPALSYHFPIRNRIISGLADAVIVVEARIKSGSLITANYAIEQNKNVYAIPGRIDNRLSEGTNDLIGQGAIPALSPSRILRDLGIKPVIRSGRSKKEDLKGLSENERKVYLCLSKDPISITQIQEACGMSMGSIGVALAKLLLAEKIKEVSKGLYIKR